MHGVCGDMGMGVSGHMTMKRWRVEEAWNEMMIP